LTLRHFEISVLVYFCVF